MIHTRKFTWTALTVLTVVLIQPAGAVPATIVDKYEGSDAHGHGDVIGSDSNFQNSSMDVSLCGKMLTVCILSTFADKVDNHLFESLTGGKGIGYDDLFLGSSWTPYGTSPYTGDDTYTGTTWTDGFSLDDRWMSEVTPGTGTLYSLNNAVSDKIPRPTIIQTRFWAKTS